MSVEFNVVDRTLNVTANPTPKPVSQYTEMLVQLTVGGGGWTIAIEGSIDGTNWHTITSVTPVALVLVASDTTAALGRPWRWLRTRVTVAGAGATPEAILHGRRIDN
jgi:hypothetical protein